MTVVVGTGPAGLTAAYLLAKRGQKVTVVDKSDKPGGLWRGFDYHIRVPRPLSEMAKPLHETTGDESPRANIAGVHFETGMHWYVECGIPAIDHFWRSLLPAGALHEIPREIAGCWWNDKLHTNSPYPDVRGGLQFSNRPVLEKLWGVPLEDLAPGADRLIKIDRVVAYGEHMTALAYSSDPKAREHFAWPDQRTLPVQFQSGRSSFYPKRGMIALVEAAICELKKMGVAFRLGSGADAAIKEEAAGQWGLRVIWASGLKNACDMVKIPWPKDMTPPRRLKVVNGLLDAPPGGDIHYAFSYDDDALFRVTWYAGFTTPNDRRVTFEYLLPERNSKPARHHEKGIRVLGEHDLGPVLPVPTEKNEALLDQVRAELGKVPSLTIIGSGAKRGLFFQPEVLQHLYGVCS